MMITLNGANGFNQILNISLGGIRVDFMEEGGDLKPVMDSQRLVDPLIVDRAKRLAKEYLADAQIIANRYPGGFEGITTLDLSKLELKHLPPHLIREWTHVTHLDISFNNIHWLPAELINLSNLLILDISGNTKIQPHLERFSFLLNVSNLTVKANDIDFCSLPRGWAGRLISNVLEGRDSSWACKTQSFDSFDDQLTDCESQEPWG